MTVAKQIKESLLHLLFPHVCVGCGRDTLDSSAELCMRCVAAMPETNFEKHLDNPAEKIFWGRLPLEAASAQFYFTKESLMQHLMHQFKYKGNKELGLQLGRIIGDQLLNSGRFQPDALVPLPLFPAKERKRGYNQAAVLCEGMAAVMKVPVLYHAVARPQHTETQTKKGRIERWQNMEGKFVIKDAASIRHKQLLLVDDVVTTGATLEACGAVLLQEENVKLSLVCLCIASKL